MSALVDIIAGARPNFMKIAPIIRALQERKAHGSVLDWRLVHTGQHYDPRMSGDFFKQLGIPEPDVNLEVGSGSHAGQTAAIMVAYEKLLLERESDLCLVVGDVTSTMACSITAQKLHIPVAHVEGGLRSGDWTMPEEINRLVTDSVTDWFFTTSRNAGEILRCSGVGEERIFFVGNTMIDTLLANLERIRPPAFVEEQGIDNGEYLVLTLHRPANVDEPANLARLLGEVARGSEGKPVVFPVHPRTRQVCEQIGELPDNLILEEPQPYLEFIWLVRNALGVITDSGGITEEATVMGIPCMTLRNTTERPETVEIGTNELLGTDPERIAPALKRLLSGSWKKGEIPEMWDGKTGERIAATLEDLASSGRLSRNEVRSGRN